MGYLVGPVDWATHQQALLGIRFAVFVREQGVPAELEHDAHDAAALHLLAQTTDGDPVGTARLLPDGHIGRMAVLPGWRGRGIGAALLRAAIDTARTRGLDQVILSAQCQAEPFYRRFGFEARGGIFKEAGIDHREMVLPLRTDSD